MEASSTTRVRREGDPLGIVSFGVFLIIVAIDFIIYPEIPSDVITWLRSWKTGPTMLPDSLVWPLIWFLTATGIWSLVQAAIRIVSRIRMRNSISDAFSGMFMLTAAFLFKEYASRLISLNVLLSGLVISLGALILLGSGTAYLLHDKL